ncbi:MAG: glycine C-acetyltransferase, partial [bacterium]|nr:glycine C-acetyltransferase [bacterium]
MFDKVREELRETLSEIEAAGLYKRERVIVSDQKADIKLNTGAEVVNFCANNYLGLSNHPEIIQAAKDGMDSHGFGLSSVR